MNTAINTASKKDKIIYWVFTGIFVAFDGLLPALTFNSELAKEGISHLGYPDYFRIELSAGKIIGGILLILPMVPPRFKEWAYVGFGISIISAFIGHLVTDGLNGETFFPIVIMIILVISYVYYHKIKRHL